MENIILQILRVFFFFFFFFFFSFPVIIYSKNSCPVSSCQSNSYLPISYPFKLEYDRPLKNCDNYINLKCSDEEGRAVINLPDSGDYYVDFIDYYTPSIDLSDPGGCLQRRLMTNFSFYPLEPFRFRNYTFYTCPRQIYAQQFPPIDCMSNSTNVTIAASHFPTGYLKEVYGCETIATSRIPVSSTSDDDDFPFISGDLQLTWNLPACKECEEAALGKSVTGDDSQSSKWPKIFSSSFFIPSVVVLVVFFGLACLLRFLKLTAGRYNASGDETNVNATIPQSTTLVSTGDTAPGEATNGTDPSSKDDDSPCTKIVVVDESQGTSLRNGETSCSICLEEYKGKDTVRYLSQCGHYFHAQCVDQWLHKSTTCPVCRTKLSSFCL